MDYQKFQQKSHQNDLIKSFFRTSWGAHHPTCRYYSDHLIKISGTFLCIGCTFLSLGFLIGTLLIFFLNLYMLPSLILFLVGVTLSPSAIIQVKYGQKKWMKISLRFILGTAFSFLISSVLVLPWNPIGIVTKIILVLIIYITTKRVLKFRSRRIDDPCQDCPEGVYPFCTHKLPEMKAILKKHEGTPIPELEQDQVFIPLISSLVKQFESKGENTLHIE